MQGTHSNRLSNIYIGLFDHISAEFFLLLTLTEEVCLFLEYGAIHVHIEGMSQAHGDIDSRGSIWVLKLFKTFLNFQKLTRQF